jgi:cobalt/nickel transport system ATP-binding protein
VLGENRRVLADGPTADILADRDLLIRANLIHEHLHEHGGTRHAHAHDAEHHDAAGDTAGGHVHPHEGPVDDVEAIE